jgi:hypothetical protein
MIRVLLPKDIDEAFAGGEIDAFAGGVIKNIVRIARTIQRRDLLS